MKGRFVALGNGYGKELEVKRLMAHTAIVRYNDGGFWYEIIVDRDDIEIEDDEGDEY